MTERSRYLAYLLRLWQVGSGQEATWRASLEDAHTGERQGFSDLDDLFHFLRQETGVSSGVDKALDIHREGGEPMD